MRYPAVVFVLLGALAAGPRLPPVSTKSPPTAREPDARAPDDPSSAWSNRAREDVDEATRRHVRVLERLADRLPAPARTEMARVRDTAAMARETAARAFRSPSRNEMMQARVDVRDAFRQSRTSLHRLSAGMAPRASREVRAALERIAAQQSRALRAFDDALGLPAEEAASNRSRS